MKQAAIDAGLLENQIYMISELEAAAVHCLTDLCEAKGNLKVCLAMQDVTRGTITLTNYIKVKVGEVYVIVDCGDETMVRCKKLITRAPNWEDHSPSQRSKHVPTHNN